MRKLSCVIVLILMSQIVTSSEVVDLDQIVQNQESLRWSIGQMCYVVLNVLSSVLSYNYLAPQTRTDIEHAITMVHGILRTLAYE